jgi:hypothetical protein
LKDIGQRLDIEGERDPAIPIDRKFLAIIGTNMDEAGDRQFQIFEKCNERGLGRNLTR